MAIGTDGKNRCFPTEPNKPLYEEYHDNEWGIPVHDDGKHFEMILLEGAQAGLSWETILNKREGYRAAFLKIQQEFGSFDAYVWGFVGGRQKVNHWQGFSDLPAKTPESDALSKDLKKRGMTFVGSTIVYAYMQAVGMVYDHLATCWKAPRA